MINEETLQFINKYYPNRKTAILFGTETHVCILQTALDLINLGYTVYVLADGVSSMRRLDRTAGFLRL